MKSLLALTTKQQKKSLYFSALLNTLCSVNEYASIFAIYLFINVLSAQTSNKVSPGASSTSSLIQYFHSLTIGDLILLMLVLFTLKSILGICTSWYQERLLTSIARTISGRLYTRYIWRSYDEGYEGKQSEIINRVSSMPSLYARSVIGSLLVVISEAFMTLPILITLAQSNLFVFATLFMVVAISICSFNYLFKHKLSAVGARYQHIIQEMVGHISSTFRAKEEIELYHNHDYFIAKHVDSLNKHDRIVKLYNVILNCPRYVFELIMIIAMLGVISLLMMTKNLSFSLLGLYVYAAYRILPAVNRILSALSQYNYNINVIDVLKTELNTDTDTSQPSYEQKLFGSIRINHIDFAYPKKPATLCDVNIDIHRGDRIGIMGASGEGKSTLIRVLIGLISTYEGEILLDGHRIEKGSLHRLIKIGYVSQNMFLFNDSIAQNISLTDPNNYIDETKLMRCIEQACLHEFIKNKSLYDARELGEDGQLISGGEKQRIIIARSLYQEPSLLILDEATSALDIETESTIISNLIKSNPDMTIVIISHRPSTLKGCTRQYRLVSGFLVDMQDAHNELDSQLQIETV